LKLEKPDIIHTHSSKAGILGRFAANLAKVPVIIHSIHGFGFNPYQKFFVRRLFMFLERWTAKFTDSLIAVSSRNIEEGLMLGIGTKDQYVLIRSGVDIQKIRKRASSCDTACLRSQLDISEEAKIVLNVAPFKPQKDPVAFVKLARSVSKEIPGVQFLMVGDGQMRSNITQRIENLKLQETVKLLGWRRDVPELLHLSDVFVLTSLWEGLPRAAVESLIVGKPVVAFAVDGIPEVVKNGENGFLIPQGSLDLMSEKIVQILSDQGLRETFSKNASKTIDTSFDIHRMVSEQDALYSKLVSTPRPDLTSQERVVNIV
jgi:glycosyltransferase involved in cell wall biosynthesis